MSSSFQYDAVSEVSHSWSTGDGPHRGYMASAAESCGGYSTPTMHQAVPPSFLPPSLHDSTSNSNVVTPTPSTTTLSGSTPDSVDSPLPPSNNPHDVLLSPREQQTLAYHTVYGNDPFTPASSAHMLTDAHDFLLSPQSLLASNMHGFYHSYLAFSHPVSITTAIPADTDADPTSFPQPWSDSPVFAHSVDALWSPDLDSGSLSDQPYRPPSRRRPTSRRQHNQHTFASSPVRRPPPPRAQSYPSSPVIPAPSSSSETSTIGPDRARLFPCPHCLKPFARSHDMQRHARGHVPGPKYNCEKCGHTFRRPDAVKRHLKAACRGV